MANTYSQINIHCVFAVKGRENLILKGFKNELFQYISGILKNIQIYPLAVGGWKDHVHIFFELKPDSKISEIISTVKSSSSKWINSKKLVKGKFEWQEGYSAFSYSRSQRNYIIKYIENQENHHKEKSFKEEYLEFLKIYHIDYNPNFIFDFYEPI